MFERGLIEMGNEIFTPKSPAAISLTAFRKKRKEAEEKAQMTEGSANRKPKPKKVAPKAAIPIEKRTVWFKCRKEGCEGTSAEYSEVLGLTRYKCLVCGRTFSFRR